MTEGATGLRSAFFGMIAGFRLGRRDVPDRLKGREYDLEPRGEPATDDPDALAAHGGSVGPTVGAISWFAAGAC